MKRFLSLLIIGAAVATSSINTFAENVNSDLYNKNKSRIEDFKGNIEFKNKSEIEIKGEKGGSISTTRVNVNTPEISGEGEVTISNEDKTKYKDIEAPAIVDADVDINAPIVHGDDIDVIIEDGSETEFDNVKAGKVYKYKYTYNKVTKVPELEELKEKLLQP